MKNVVVIGGGTGLSTLLKGLKLFPMNITAIVTVSDYGEPKTASREILKSPFSTLPREIRAVASSSVGAKTIFLPLIRNSELFSLGI